MEEKAESQNKKMAKKAVVLWLKMTEKVESQNKKMAKNAAFMNID